MGSKIVTIDCSGGTFVACCSVHPWRGAPHTEKVWAMRDADRHRRLEHPEAARDTDKKRRRRGTLSITAGW